MNEELSHAQFKSLDRADQAARPSDDNCLKIVIEGKPKDWYCHTVRWYVSGIGIVKQRVESDSITTEMALTKYHRAAAKKAKAEQSAMN